MQSYKHRQIPTLLLYTLGFGSVMTAALSTVVSPGPAKVVTGVVLVILLLFIFLFWSLTVVVTSDRLTVWFGFGVIRRVFRIEDIRDSRIVRNPWYYGWGIRLTPHGWLFNVSGFDAVELEFKNHRKFRIGTDEPHQLLTAIQQAGQHASEQGAAPDGNSASLHSRR